MSLEEILMNIEDKNIGKLMSLLTMMEFEELIQQQVGNGYKIKGED